MGIWLIPEKKYVRYLQIKKNSAISIQVEENLDIKVDQSDIKKNNITEVKDRKFKGHFMLKKKFYMMAVLFTKIVEKQQNIQKLLIIGA